MTNPEHPVTRVRVSLPPGTSSGSFNDVDELEYRSDQDIAAGRIPNNTNTARYMENLIAFRCLQGRVMNREKKKVEVVCKARH